MTDTHDFTLVRGRVHAVLTRPDGTVRAECMVDNIVTDVGDSLLASRATGATTVPLATGMRLGTGSTAVAKNGAGAALAAYLSGSAYALDATYPQVSGAVVTFRRTWAAGQATTASPVTEAVLTNDTVTDATAAAGVTLARVLLAGIPSKPAGDALTLTWTWTVAGQP